MCDDGFAIADFATKVFQHYQHEEIISPLRWYVAFVTNLPTAVDMASFVFPRNGNFSSVSSTNLINIYDTLEVTYTSPWSALNATVFCQATTDAGSSNYMVWQAAGNPIASSGTYRIGSIANLWINGNGVAIKSYPVWCSVKLTKYGNDKEALGGDNWRVTSSPDDPVTYTMTSSTATSSAVTQSTSKTVATDSKALTSETATSSVSEPIASSSTPIADPTSSVAEVSSSMLAIASVSSPTSSETSISTPSQISDSHANSIGLGSGGLAGIAIGTFAVVVLIAALCFIIYRLRKKARGHQLIDQNNDSKFELAAPVALKDQKISYFYDTKELDSTSRLELAAERLRKPKRPLELA